MTQGVGTPLIRQKSETPSPSLTKVSGGRVSRKTGTMPLGSAVSSSRGTRSG